MLQFFFSNSIVIDSAISIEKQELYVLTSNTSNKALKKYGVVSIKFIGNQYIHRGNILFSEEDAKEYFDYLSSLEWNKPKPKYFANL